MLAPCHANRLPARTDAVPGRTLAAYLAGLGTAAALIVGATVLASLGLDLVFG